MEMVFEGELRRFRRQSGRQIELEFFVLGQVTFDDADCIIFFFLLLGLRIRGHAADLVIPSANFNWTPCMSVY